MASFRDINETNLANPREVLALVGLTPIPQEKVLAYKAAQLRKHSGNFWWKVANCFGIDPKGSSPEAHNWNRKAGNYIVGALFTFAPMTVCFGVLWIASSILPVSRNVAGTFFDLGGASLAIALICAGALWVASEVRVVHPGVWKDVAYRWHEAPVWVHDIFLKAQTVYPNATFMVSELREEVTRGLLDPILWIKIGDQSIALAIWDETGERIDL